MFLKRWFRFGCGAVVAATALGLVFAVPSAHAADDTARFYGQWKTIISSNGQTVTIISIHGADGFKNYVQTPSGFTFAGSGAFSAVNGIWMAASPPPNNGGTYRFINADAVICNNAVGQTVTWRRDSTSLGPIGDSHAPAPSPSPSQPSSHDSNSPPNRNKRGLSPEKESDNNGLEPGNNYALVIGIDDYPAPLPRLKTAVNDAGAFSALLASKYGFQVTTLVNQDATRDKILGAITHFRKSLGENDSFLVYYAGHGSYDRATDKGYWLPVDADPDPLVTSRDISADDLITEVRGLAARHVLIISDSCFSGDLSRDAGDFSPSDGNQAYIHRMQRAPSRTLMASGSDEPVSDSGSQGHSVFAASLLQAMQSHGGQTFTADDLFVSIRKSVLARSGQSPQYATLRNSIKSSASLDMGDFVFIPKGTNGK